MRESVKFFECPPELLFSSEITLQDGIGDFLQRDAAEELDPAHHGDGVIQLHLHIFEPGLAKESGKAWANIGIGPAALHQAGVPMGVPLERGAARFRKVATEIDVFDHDHAARPGVPLQRG